MTLVEIGQACLDWYNDTSECHFCLTDEHGNHDPYAECPVDIYTKKKQVIRPDGSIG